MLGILAKGSKASSPFESLSLRHDHCILTRGAWGASIRVRFGAEFEVDTVLPSQGKIAGWIERASPVSRMQRRSSADLNGGGVRGNSSKGGASLGPGIRNTRLFRDQRISWQSLSQSKSMSSGATGEHKIRTLVSPGWCHWERSDHSIMAARSNVFTGKRLWTNPPGCLFGQSRIRRFPID